MQRSHHWTRPTACWASTSRLFLSAGPLPIPLNSSEKSSSPFGDDDARSVSLDVREGAIAEISYLGTWKSCQCPGQAGWMVNPVSVAVDGTGSNVYVLGRRRCT
jgi:hypothetical protein